MTEQEEHLCDLAAGLLALGLRPEAARGLAALVDLVEGTGHGAHGEIPGYMEHPLPVREAVGRWLEARGLTVAISGRSPDGKYLVELDKMAR